ncbi:chymotrypsin-like elastase family member 2A isoform X2 [Andrena cerasifolii]|uniref:chymotrypsin-like elastase family member 2A isoform X2 n=1 Tax=Andrena cerasifolii TaxID=2819439 RepID=UPI00403811DB
MPSTRCGHNLDIVKRYGGSSTMVSVVAKAALLLYFLHLVAHVTGQSSCIPSFFRYMHNETSDETSGRIEMFGSPKGVPLQLSAGLSIATALPTKYVGKIVLAQSREQSVQAVQQGRSLKYNIYFPLRRPLPQLTSLWYNNRLVCTGPRATGQIVTSIVLNHTLYPPDIVPLEVDEVNTISHQTNIYDLPLPTVSSRPPVRPTLTPATIAESIPPATTAEPKPIAGTDQGAQECGRNTIGTINPLVAGGTKTEPGQWPWLVAIYISRQYKFELQCAGTLVTNTHVITAAHCFQQGSQTLLSGAFLVSVGRYKLHDWKERWAVRREVIKYTIHPDYQLRSDHETAGGADSDLAVLTLNRRLEYTKMIQPICLWSGKIKLEYVVGETGFVVGWGRDENGNFLEEPRHISSPIVSQEVCLRSNKDFVVATSSRTFCAGKRDGTGPCNGDSGSGFVMYDTNTTRYYLRGVVSRSLKNPSTLSCDLRNYVVYVDTAKYLDWIREQISQ